MWGLVTFSLLLISSNVLAVRNLSSQIICSDGKCSLTSKSLIYTTAKGDHDTLHYFWSTMGRPSVLIVQTPVDVLLNNISWNRFNLSFNGSVTSSLGVELFKIWEFSDQDDKGKFDPSMPTATFSLEKLPWRNINESFEHSKSEVTASFKTGYRDSKSYFSNNGSITFQVTANGDKGRNGNFPHLSFTPDSVEIALILDNLVPQLNCSRFGAELIMFYQPVESEIIPLVNVVDTVDDEFTPGVFKRMELILPKGNLTSQAYLHWKPVSYRGTDRGVSKSVSVKNYPLSINFTEDSSSIVSMYFSNSHEKYKVAMNVTFGTDGDKYYSEYHYTTWNFVIGLGKVPNEPVSLLVILVIIIGFGLPIVLAAFVGGYIVVKKFKNNKRELLINADY